MIIWITGLSGSGKTTLSNELYNFLSRSTKALVLLDGDVFRRVMNFTDNRHYNMQSRLANAKRIQSLCSLLDNQNINVICAIQLLFDEIRYENKKIFSHYLEINLECDRRILEDRDTKMLYRDYYAGKIKDVVGIDLPYIKPSICDYSVNTGELTLQQAIDTLQNIFDHKLMSQLR